jgi:site-specific DNA recombinase
MPFARCYLRVSTDEQDNGLEAQRATVTSYYELKLKPLGFAFGGCYVDADMSGGVPLADWPEGRRLAVDLQPGDVAVFAKLDRGFRNLADLALTIDDWATRGIDFHLLDLGVDTATPVGQLVIHVMGAFAQFERRRIAERIREALAVRRRNGRPVSGKPPHGFQIAHARDETGKVVDEYFVPDEHERRVGRRIVAWREQGLTFAQIYFHLLRFKVRTTEGNEWSLGTIRRTYAAEVQLQAQERIAQHGTGS